MLLSLSAALLGIAALANNITVSTATLSGQNTTAHTEVINFNVAWENSWRTSTNESNYDGAWIFVKFRKMGTQDWRHCTINAAGAAAGTGGAFSVPTDGKGAFIYKSADGIGNVSYAGNQLVWNYGTDGILDNETVEIRVFALEMVYIPAGSFQLGSGGTEGNAFYSGTTATTPYLVASNGIITTGAAAGNLNAAGASIAGTIPAAFPKGYNAFWIMKYECSQQQYGDFLNHIDLAKATPNNPGTGYFTGTHPSLAAVQPERAIGSIGFNRTAALADWSGLRPYTELEYEKASRGYNTPAVANEYVWGNTTINVLATVANTGLQNESVATPVAANANIQSGYGSPVRTGIFARAAGSDRIISGSSYYGVMNLGDNTSEVVVTTGSAAGRTVTDAVHGDGYLTSGGGTDIPAWQSYTTYGLKGGCYSCAISDARTSERGSVMFFSSYPGDNNLATSGARLVRTAP